MDSKGTYIPELSTWRFLFILMIFFHHVELFPGGGATGVAFFFILGGFTLTLGYLDRVLKNGFEYGSYLKKRLIKFYPLHWLILLLFVPLNLLCSVPVSIRSPNASSRCATVRSGRFRSSTGSTASATRSATSRQARWRHIVPTPPSSPKKRSGCGVPT